MATFTGQVIANSDDAQESQRHDRYCRIFQQRQQRQPVHRVAVYERHHPAGATVSSVILQPYMVSLACDDPDLTPGRRRPTTRPRSRIRPTTLAAATPTSNTVTWTATESARGLSTRPTWPRPFRR